MPHCQGNLVLVVHLSSTKFLWKRCSKHSSYCELIAVVCHSHCFCQYWKTLPIVLLCSHLLFAFCKCSLSILMDVNECNFYCMVEFNDTSLLSCQTPFYYTIIQLLSVPSQKMGYWQDVSTSTAILSTSAFDIVGSLSSSHADDTDSLESHSPFFPIAHYS